MSAGLLDFHLDFRFSPGFHRLEKTPLSDYHLRSGGDYLAEWNDLAKRVAEGDAEIAQQRLAFNNKRDLINKKSGDFWRATCRAVSQGQTEINRESQRVAVQVEQDSGDTAFRLNGTHNRPDGAKKASLQWYPDRYIIDISIPNDRRSPIMFSFEVGDDGALLVKSASTGEIDSERLAHEFLEVLTTLK